MFWKPLFLNRIDHKIFDIFKKLFRNDTFDAPHADQYSTINMERVYFNHHFESMLELFVLYHKPNKILKRIYSIVDTYLNQWFMCLKFTKLQIRRQNFQKPIWTYRRPFKSQKFRNFMAKIERVISNSVSPNEVQKICRKYAKSSKLTRVVKLFRISSFIHEFFFVLWTGLDDFKLSIIGFHT